MEYGRDEKRHGEKKLTRVNFKFWLNDVENMELVNWLKELTAKEKFTETVIEILEFVRLNSLEKLKSLESLKREKIIAEIAEIKSRTSHRESKSFKPIPENIPSEEAHVAPEEKNLTQVINKNWNNYVNTLRQLKDGWSVTCRLCETGFVQIPTQLMAIDRFKKHLEDSHMTELIKTV